MEKAMHQAHGMGYAEYSNKHENRMLVEKRRERDYAASQQIVAEVNRKVHNNLS
ncbi:hypothetical protein [Metabacillus lacus]|uniref:hypothetical protein n=1 Tax=Metabacillus lacus TaxID=1983721 RepID=UPI00147857AB|nr:hypothetical protein [Metabacillus lacus]